MNEPCNYNLCCPGCAVRYQITAQQVGELLRCWQCRTEFRYEPSVETPMESPGQLSQLVHEAVFSRDATEADTAAETMQPELLDKTSPFAAYQPPAYIPPEKQGPTVSCPSDSRHVFGLMATFVISLCLLFVWMAVGSLSLGVTALLDNIPLDLKSLATDGYYASVSSIVSTPVAILLIWLVAASRPEWRGTEYLGINRCSITRFILGSLLGIAVIVGFEFGCWAFDVTSGGEFGIEMLQSARYPILWLIATCVMAPIWEEMFFRGFLFRGLYHWKFDNIFWISNYFPRLFPALLQRSLRRIPIGPVSAVLLPTLLFAVVHLQYDVVGMAACFVIGLALALVRVYTKSLWPCIFLHALNNLIAFVLTLIAM